MPRPAEHLRKRIEAPLYACIHRNWGEEDASVPWLDRERLNLLASNWLSNEQDHALDVTLPERTHPILVTLTVLEAYDGARNPFGIGVLHVCSYRVPRYKDVVALDRLLTSIDPAHRIPEISGPISYSGRADIVDALRGHLRGRSGSNESGSSEPPSQPGRDRIVVADELLATPVYAPGDPPSLLIRFAGADALRAALRHGPTWFRLAVRSVPGLEVMDRIQIVLQLPDGVMIQAQATVLKVRRGCALGGAAP